MKTQNKLWGLLKPIVVLVLISAIGTAALSATSVITAPVIAANLAAAEEAAKREVLPEGADFAPVTDTTGFNSVIVACEAAGNGAGWVFTTETKGFGGTVRAMFGINADGAITGSKVVDHGETEGIGSKVVKDGSDFQKQLLGLTRDEKDTIVATTGASFSSSAMKQAVNAVFDAYRLLAAQGGDQGGEGTQLPLYEADPPANLTDAALAEYYGSAVFTDVSGGSLSFSTSARVWSGVRLDALTTKPALWLFTLRTIAA